MTPHVQEADLYARALLMAGASTAKGVRSLPLSCFVPSLSRFSSLSPLRLRSVTLRSSSSPLSHFKHCSPFTTYGRPCFSRTIFSSLFDIALALFKDKVRCLCHARARALPLFAVAPSDHSLAFSLSLPLLLSLSPPLNLYTHKDGHDDVTKHVTIV